MFISNLLLRSFDAADLEFIAPELALVDLSPPERIIEPSKPIKYIWFPEDAVTSIVATAAQGCKSEIALTGCEGVVDLGAINGVDTSPFECIVQVAGRAWRLPVEMLRTAFAAREGIRAIFGRYTQAFIVQIAQTALTNSTHTIEQRLARWLLMTHDRIPGNDIFITHQNLSHMLNVRRAGVTTTLSKLGDAGLVSARRSQISVIDRHGLEALAAEAYGVAESEYCRLLGADFRRRAYLNGTSLATDPESEASD